jgi:hypothetical protein
LSRFCFALREAEAQRSGFQFPASILYHYHLSSISISISISLSLYLLSRLYLYLVISSSCSRCRWTPNILHTTRVLKRYKIHSVVELQQTFSKQHGSICLLQVIKRKVSRCIVASSFLGLKRYKIHSEHQMTL